MGQYKGGGVDSTVDLAFFNFLSFMKSCIPTYLSPTYEFPLLGQTFRVIHHRLGVISSRMHDRKDYSR